MRAALALVLAAVLGAPLAAAPAAAPAAALPASGGVVAATDDEPSPSPTASPDPGLPLEVDVEAITAVLEPGADLVVSGTVHNRGDDAVGTPRVLVRVDRSAYVARTSLDAWREADDDDAAGSTVLTVDLETPLPAGGSVPFSAVVPAAQVGLRASSSWGPRGVAVEVVDRDDRARVRLGLARTFTVWFPPQDVSPTLLSLVVPVVGPAVDPHAEPDDAGRTPQQRELEELTASGGRLAHVLAATAPSPAVGWLVDPWLVEQAAAVPAEDVDGEAGTGEEADAGDGEGSGTDEGTDGGTDGEGSGGEATDGDSTDAPPRPAAAPPAAVTWAAALRNATAGREVGLLPYGDVDAEALAHAGAAGPWELALRQAASAAAPAGLPTAASTSLVLPAQPLPDLTTAAFAAGTTRTLVVGPGALPAPDALTYTPSARTTVTTDAGDVRVLVPDARLSAAFEDGGVGTGRPGDGEPPVVDAALDELDPHPQLTPATAAQDLLAELAVITRERPSDSRHLLATTSRAWDPDPAVVAAQLGALEAAPWVTLAPVADLTRPAAGDADDDGAGTDSGSGSDDVERGTLPRQSSAAVEVDAAEIAALEGTLALRARMAAVAERPAELLGDPTTELLAPLSVAWRSDADGRSQVVAASEARTTALRDAVRVEPGSDILLISTSSQMPVLVQNTLDQAVTVQVALRPDAAALEADEPVSVTVPAQGQQEVLLPVHAVQSDDVQVTVELRAPDGVVLDDRTTFTVRVRAEWEGIGAAVMGVLLALALVLGIVRTVRRGRRGSRAAPVAAGPDALSPEEAVERGETLEDVIPGLDHGPGGASGDVPGGASGDAPGDPVADPPRSVGAP